MSVFSEIQQAFISKKARKVIGLLIKSLKYQTTSLFDLLDLIGGLLKKDSPFFIKKIYPPIISKIEKFKHLDVDEIDNYMLKNYCFISEEKILSKTYGNIEDSYSSSVGRIYITNYRIIISGKQLTQVSYGVHPSIASTAVSHQRNLRRTAITKAIRELFSDYEFVEWGYSYPITGSFNAKMTDTFFRYFVNIQTEQAERKFKVKIIPKKFKQPKDEFVINRKIVLNTLQDLIVYQSYAKSKSQGVREVKPITESPTGKLLGKILDKSDAALLIQFGDKQAWIPRSVIKSSFEEVVNQEQEFDIPSWVLKRHHLN